MTIRIKKIDQAELLRRYKRQPDAGSGEPSLKKHFGKLIRNIDGMEYQKKVRSDED